MDCGRLTWWSRWLGCEELVVGVGGELESEMGCTDGNDCEIPTTRAFDLMDRFSSEDMRQ